MANTVNQNKHIDYKSANDISSAIVQNGNEKSEPFSTTFGLKQGGALSPRLFSIYVEEIIEEIGKLNEGIKIGDITIDIILYADDILIIKTRNAKNA